MADTAVAITAGAGTNVDTRTEGTNGNHRQVVVLGDPATNAGVAPVDVVHGLRVNQGRATTATLTTQADQDSNATLLAANTARLAALIVNDSTEILYIKYGATATADDWNVRLYANEERLESVYNGRIDGIWAAAGSGKARITEFTA
jgi:hypothetical protein